MVRQELHVNSDGGGPDNYSPKLWDAEKKKPLWKLEGHVKRVYAAFFCKNEKYIITGSFDGSVRLWEISSKKEIRIILQLPVMIRNVAFSSFSNEILISSEEDFVRVISFESGKEVARLKGHEKEVFGLAYSNSGKYILTGDRDNLAVIWERLV